MFGTTLTNDPERDADAIRRWRCAQIVMRDGKLESVRRRWTNGSVSLAGIWFRKKFARPKGDVCIIDYHQPLGMRAFLTLDYVYSGTATTARTCVGACNVLNDIARIRGSLAIVTHVANESISDRLLLKHGWQRHLTHWSGRHWIRRFYDGYAKPTLSRYL